MVPVGLIALTLSGVAGCKKDEPPKPDPASTARPASSARSKLNTRNPMGPVAKIDPQAMKDYRLDVCYFGTLSLRQARDAYLASLGKDEPSEKKIPSFGIPAPTAAAAASGSAAAGPSGAPKAPPAPKPTAVASASGAASAGPIPVGPDRRPDVMVRAPHERNARACTAAIALKEPPMGDVDAAVNGFATFAVELAKDITTAHQYYAREEYKKDSFAKGKELHKKLVEQFAKLDELQGKLGTALTAWRSQHPADITKMEEGEKVARAALDEAREVYTLVAFKKADGEAWKTATDKLEKSIAALKTYSDGHAADPWAKIMLAPFEVFAKTVKESKVTADKTFESEAFLNLVSNFTGLVEARQRAISRHAMARPALPPLGTGAPGAPPAPPATGAPAEQH
ncbi:Hypothetical protein A7982_06564 [Minicystis rosea]|nr:Hypothetical protein A7982_06564 [Minicystis rosea]